MPRFIANETFTSEETGKEYAQGAIYDVDPDNAPLLAQWKAEGKVRDPDTPSEDEADAAEEKEDEDDTDEPA